MGDDTQGICTVSQSLKRDWVATQMAVENGCAAAIPRPAMRQLLVRHPTIFMDVDEAHCHIQFD